MSLDIERISFSEQKQSFQQLMTVSSEAGRAMFGGICGSLSRLQKERNPIVFWRKCLLECGPIPKSFHLDQPHCFFDVVKVFITGFKH